ncbi:MAG: hypothetical protein Q8K91_13595 [Hylemonella sp.]|nr:hypothetical protein [Hylemonella sp.]MDP1938234.1 hypothetical protein [Hylemonella sp.]
MRTHLPFPDRSGTGHMTWLQHGLAWLVCTGLLMCLLGLMVSAKALPVMASHATQGQSETMPATADHGHTAQGASCSATQLPGSCTDAEPGDWADLDILPAVGMAMRVVRVLQHVETRSPLIQVGVQPRLPPPRNLR